MTSMLSILCICLSLLTWTEKVKSQPDSMEPPVVMAALGDSLTTAFHSYRLGDNRDYSWATGSNPVVQSLHLRLEEFLGREIESHNEAIAGAESYQLYRQLRRALIHDPQYYSINIGGNDLCLWQDDNYERKLRRFERDFRAVMTQILEARSDSVVFLAPIPDIIRLKHALRETRSCQRMWDELGPCRVILHSRVDAAGESRFRERWNAANDVLERVASLDPQRIHFDRNLADTPFGPDEVSRLDCFHPNRTGQALMAEKVWSSFQP